MSDSEIKKEKEIIGRLEKASIPVFHIYDIDAKIDTGAYNSAIHTSETKIVRVGDQRYLKFRVLDEDHPSFKDVWHRTSQFEKRYVKNSSGTSEERYVIKTDVIIKGRKIKMRLGLSNRKDMRYPLLIGRRSIKKHFIIDASKKFTN